LEAFFKGKRMACYDCPRECKAGSFCGKDLAFIRVAKVMRHMYEEPIICPSDKGCGAVFFSHCSLKCSYCQNYTVSHLGEGKDLTLDELVEIFKKLEKSGVENIDLVTPTHQTSNIIKALDKAKVSIPVVWNTSGYERVENIEKLKDYVDVFLFDFKYFSPQLSMELSKAPDYFDVCMRALKKAREVIPHDVIENGVMKKGIIVRHLILPGHTNDSIKIFQEIKNSIGTDVYVSVMSQYSPFYKAKEHVGINRTLKPLEIKKVELAVMNLGFTKGFVQDLSSCSQEYTPDFSLDKFWEV